MISSLIGFIFSSVFSKWSVYGKFPSDCIGCCCFYSGFYISPFCVIFLQGHSGTRHWWKETHKLPAGSLFICAHHPWVGLKCYPDYIFLIYSFFFSRERLFHTFSSLLIPPAPQPPFRWWPNFLSSQGNGSKQKRSSVESHCHISTHLHLYAELVPPLPLWGMNLSNNSGHLAQSCPSSPISPVSSESPCRHPGSCVP